MRPTTALCLPDLEGRRNTAQNTPANNGSTVKLEPPLVEQVGCRRERAGVVVEPVPEIEVDALSGAHTTIENAGGPIEACSACRVSLMHKSVTDAHVLTSSDTSSGHTWQLHLGNPLKPAHICCSRILIHIRGGIGQFRFHGPQLSEHSYLSLLL